MREYLSQRWEIEEGDEESVLVDEWYVVVIQLQLHVVEGNMGAVVDIISWTRSLTLHTPVYSFVLTITPHRSFGLY